MRILGIDPGTTATGYGVVERADGRVRHVAHGTLRPPKGGTLALRLAYLQRALVDVIGQHRPDVAAVEQVFVAASARSALVLGHARGAVLAAVGGAGLPVSEYAASAIKQSVAGDGRASKQQVQRMVRRTLDLDRAPGTDAADALAAAISHAHAGQLLALGVSARRRSRRRPSFAVARRPR